MRAGGTLNYLVGDHLGSTSLTTDAAGNKVSEIRYKAWGEVRYASGNIPTKYTFTGQYSHVDDFGLMFYNARWLDVSLGRFAQADSIIPGGVQGLDRYAYVSNSPIMYTDPTGHKCVPEIECTKARRELTLLHFETEGDRQWTEEEKAILSAGAHDVAAAIARDINNENYLLWKSGDVDDFDALTPTEAFRKVYKGSVKVIRKAGSCSDVIGYIFPNCGGWGFSNTRNEIWIFDNATPSILKAYPRLIVHELGHSFDKITGMSLNMPASTKNRDGFFGPASSWQLSTDTLYTEIYADMFVGWVYGRWQTEPATGNFTDPARGKANFMALMISYIDNAIGK
jgi:RHS repeat-associated protein